MEHVDAEPLLHAALEDSLTVARRRKQLETLMAGGAERRADLVEIRAATARILFGCTEIMAALGTGGGTAVAAAFIADDHDEQRLA